MTEKEQKLLDLIQSKFELHGVNSSFHYFNGHYILIYEPILNWYQKVTNKRKTLIPIHIPEKTRQIHDGLNNLINYVNLNKNEFEYASVITGTFHQIIINLGYQYLLGDIWINYFNKVAGITHDLENEMPPIPAELNKENIQAFFDLVYNGWKTKINRVRNIIYMSACISEIRMIEGKE